MSNSLPPRPTAAEVEAANLKRRKVRKGTHSCWECRRRKIRCQFSASDDYTCIPCKNSGRTCRSQEFIDDAQPAAPSDRGMAQRLGRLEAMMARLVDRIMPESKDKETASPRAVSASPSPSTTIAGDSSMRQTLDVLENSIADDTPVGLLLGLRNMNTNSHRSPVMLTPESDRQGSAGPSRPGRYDKISKTLHSLFLPQEDINAIIEVSSGPYFVTGQFNCFRDLMEGKHENALNVGVIPPATSHPSVLARRLLQQTISLEQLPSTFDVSKLHLRGTLLQHMSYVVNQVSDLVTSNDELVGTAEGLQCLVLQGFWHANVGNLRKAWLSYRRALSLAQLVGIDRGSAHALKWADSNTDPEHRASPSVLWYRINYVDRHLSLLLGLPVGSTDNSFTSEEFTQRDTQMEKLEKVHCVVAARIIERNANKTPQAYAMTQAIDYDLDVAARNMEPDWWNDPLVDLPESRLPMMGEFIQIVLQINHFQHLILLHLPYMLRNPSEDHPSDNRYVYSRATCTRSSREVLKRFLSFRNMKNSAFTCRHVDYTALISAMTLLVSYLRQHQSAEQPMPSCAQRQDDRKLVEMVRERMQHVAVVNHDKLSQESADILGQMMPILDSIDTSLMGGISSETNVEALKCLHLNIPYLGTINIQPSLVGKAGCPSKSGGQTPTPVSVGASAPVTAPTSSTAAMAGLSDLSALQHLQTTAAAVRPGAAAVGAALGGSDHVMAFGAMDPALGLPGDMTVNGMMMQFQPQPQDGALLEFPDMTAEAEDWALQGVDTAYWSLLNSNSMDFGTG